jgi:hypothetical protein
MVDQDIPQKAQEWFLLAKRLGWKSYDPYDILLSPPLEKLRTLSPFLARLAIQFGKFSGASIRWLLKIAPHEEAKTLSDYLESAVIFSIGEQRWVDVYLEELAQRLIARSIPTGHGVGWGLEFPYTSRFVNVAACTPNLYQSINAIQALLALYKLNHSSKCLDFALQGSHFIMDDLGVFEWRNFKWFRYWPGLDAPIVNIQASLAGVFSNLGILTGKPVYTELSDLAMQTVVNFQNDDGSWYYSVDGKANFVDGFHTGFVLQGLSEYAHHCSEPNRPLVNRVIEKGFAFFKQHLVSASGLPLGFADGSISLDGQNFAQCLQTFAICGQSSANLQAARLIWCEMMKIPSLNPGHNYQLRWTYGPAVLAAAHLFAVIVQEKKASLN